MVKLRSVGINALYLEPGRSGGSETYLRGLVPALAEVRPDLRLVVFTTPTGVSSLSAAGWDEFAELVAVRVERPRRGARVIGEQTLIPRLAAARSCDVLHSLANTAPLRPSVPSVLTVLDVIFITTNTLGLLSTFALRRLVPRAARAADARIAISAAARSEICRVLRIPESSFDVVHLGVDRPRTTPTPEDEVRSRFELDGRRVILSLGAYRPHKNQSLLVRMLAGVDGDSLLVVAGPPERGREPLATLAGQLGLSSRVRLLGYVSDADLEGLWQVASCAVSPSLVEGFGLPPIEAMARSVPVACSDIAVHREIAGDAATYFDPFDPASAAAAVKQALEAPPEAVAAGLARARLFTWEITAAATLEVYERVLRI
jgi:glycosyltransferase involved in cell wall biosynthesis